MRKLFFTFLLIISSNQHALARNITWMQTTATVKIAGPVSVFTEVQPRWFDGVQHAQIVLVRGALLYRFNPEFRVGVGYGIMPQYLPIERDESRLFQQFDWTPPHKEQFPLTFRTRLEQRWLENAPEASWRVRERIQFSWMPTKFGMYVWNEFFLNFNDVAGNIARGFDQNRFSIGPKYSVAPVTFEAGYLLQTLRTSTKDILWNSGVALSLALNL